ncbi:hypothetical protein HRbin25_00426 [bacterium HR25]|jgi:chromosome segregation ATPase|nr:hypothetical protein HRbin25_00426 [bacterium HR25]
MGRNDPEVASLREQLAELQAELEGLQAQAADAEARAAHHRQEAARAQERLREVEGALAETQALLAQREGELAAARSEVEALRARLREAAQRYREARLAASPEVPQELVSGETLEEIDRQFEQAQRIVSSLRQRLEEEAQARRFPVGSPPRRPPDLSGLSSLEKIRQGLQHR